jgi:hypothetical protein
MCKKYVLGAIMLFIITLVIAPSVFGECYEFDYFVMFQEYYRSTVGVLPTFHLYPSLCGTLAYPWPQDVSGYRFKVPVGTYTDLCSNTNYVTGAEVPFNIGDTSDCVYYKLETYLQGIPEGEYFCCVKNQLNNVQEKGDTDICIYKEGDDGKGYCLDLEDALEEDPDNCFSDEEFLGIPVAAGVSGTTPSSKPHFKAMFGDNPSANVYVQIDGTCGSSFACESHSHCGFGFNAFCKSSKRCGEKSCSSNANCPDSTVCVNGKCYRPESCSSYSDCSDSEYNCFDSICLPDADRDGFISLHSDLVEAFSTYAETDCDDTSSLCTTECESNDIDDINDCKDWCFDYDEDDVCDIAKSARYLPDVPLFSGNFLGDETDKWLARGGWVRKADIYDERYIEEVEDLFTQITFLLMYMDIPPDLTSDWYESQGDEPPEGLNLPTKTTADLFVTNFEDYSFGGSIPDPTSFKEDFRKLFENDCNDDNDDIYPGAEEENMANPCNYINDDCDNQVDECSPEDGKARACVYTGDDPGCKVLDKDGDTYMGVEFNCPSCIDCDDDDADVHPYADDCPEEGHDTCDEEDYNCNDFEDELLNSDADDSDFNDMPDEWDECDDEGPAGGYPVDYNGCRYSTDDNDDGDSRDNLPGWSV